MDYKKRCADCACLVEKNKIWCCDECFGQPCSEVDDCPCGVTDDDIAEIDTLAKIKVDVGIKGTLKEKTEKKPKTVKVSDEKMELFQTILQNLDRCDGVTRENIEILKENKLISVKIGEKIFKIDIIEQRPPKK